MDFMKMHGLGNDFVMMENPRSLTKALIKKWTHRTIGIGCDQLVVLWIENHLNQARVEFYNTDGSRAAMCGNGIRAAAHYLKIRKGAASGALKEFSLLTDSGWRHLVYLKTSGARHYYRSSMGVPGIEKKGSLFFVDTGNKHVVLMSKPDALKASALEKKYNANVEFLKIQNTNEIQVHVWERGVGWTQACGTGAVATAAVARFQERVKPSVKVRFPGGQALVRWQSISQEAYLTGWVEVVFQGHLDFHETKTR